eukprot:c29215_g1_i4 orf=294-2537(+)
MTLSSPRMQQNSRSDHRVSARVNYLTDDSDDDKPLSYRRSISKLTLGNAQLKILKKNGMHMKSEDTNAAGTLPRQNCQMSAEEASEDSDDDKPLAYRLQVKPLPKVPVRETTASSNDSDDKPLASQRHSNGSATTGGREHPSVKVDEVIKKRPSDHRTSSLDGRALKKLKGLAPEQNLAAKMEVDEDDDDEDDIPLAQRIPALANIKMSIAVKKASLGLKSTMVKKLVDARKAKFKHGKKVIKKIKGVRVDKMAPGAGGGQKWTTLEHSGVIFPPPYTPHGVKMLYEGRPVDLLPEQEEVATMFAVMRETDYVTKPKFLANFWNDWKKILGVDHVIKSLDHCDFTPIYEWHLAEKEKKKQMSSEEKKRLKEEKMKQEEKYMWALVDGVKEKVGNFRVEPPGLFRGRGEHPKMGKLKRRIYPEDITINIGEGAPIPKCPMPGHRWKEVKCDNTVTWLAFWIDPINTREFKYVFLAASSNLKGQSDKEKYEKARLLKNYIGNIRDTYTINFTSLDPTVRQIAVATYLIDRLALRAGNEKDDDEADTVGCCSLKVEHVTLVPPRSLEFDFLGKDSIRYFNTVQVEEPVYKAIGEFKKSKKPGQDLFDKLDTNKLNSHLKEIMPGLTAKVFRTYNASITLDKLLESTIGSNVPERVASYQTANKEVAVLCNHQRSVSKSHGAQMERLEGRMAELEDLLQELNVDLDRAKKGKPPLTDADGKTKRNQNPEAIQKRIIQTTQKNREDEIRHED